MHGGRSTALAALLARDKLCSTYWHWHRGLIAAGCPLFFLLVSDFGRDLLTYQLRRLPD